MAVTVDHLVSGLRVRVLRDFRDARGIQHRAGESALIRTLALDWGQQAVVLEWTRAGKMETVMFALAAKEGPRNGHMREYFFAEGRELLEPVARAVDRSGGPAVLTPVVSDEPISDPNRYAESVARVGALADLRRYEEANVQIDLILSAPDPAGVVLRRLAEDVVGLAVARAGDRDRTVFEWLRERGLHLWYAWGSTATSGGEGTACAVEIRAAEARLAGLK